MSTGRSVPTWLQGAWELLYGLYPDPPADRTRNVRNIQTPTLFGDCRIPKDWPRYPEATSLADLTDAQLRTLYTPANPNDDPADGFSGFTRVSEGNVATWHHEIDYQPPSPGLDTGRLVPAAGRTMFEHGIPPADYTEHWWSLEHGEGYFLGVKVMKILPGGIQRIHEILSVAGDHFIYARNRPVDLPPADSMQDLIEKTHATRDQILEYLDCEISHGFVLGGKVPWEIQFSTMPFLPGKPLAFADQITVKKKTGELAHRGRRPDEVWSFPINTLGIEDLLILFPPRAKSSAGKGASKR